MAGDANGYVWSVPLEAGGGLRVEHHAAKEVRTQLHQAKIASLARLPQWD